MAFQVSPGVNVSEIDLTTVVPGVSSTVGAMAGIFRWGPVGVPTLIDSENKLVDTFGRPTNGNYETFFTAANFLGYGNALYVTRAANTTSALGALATITTTTPGTGYNNNDVVVINAGPAPGVNARASFTTNGTGGITGFTITTGGLLTPGITVPVANISITNSLGGTAAGNSTVSGIVARSGDSITGALTAVANTAAITNLNSLGVRNRDDYDSRVSFDAGALYIAKCPGAIGNSLRISVCDSANAYESSVNLLANTSYNGALTLAVGSNSANIVFSGALPADANTVANTFASSGGLAVGDLVRVGNSTLGVQYLKITSIVGPNASVSGRVAVNFSDVNKLASDYVVSNTINNANATFAGVTRNWEYFAAFDAAPGQSSWVGTYGNTAANDLLHVAVVDQGGAFGGVAGDILEVYPNLSRATDAKSETGASIYYKNVINEASKYVWWTNDRTSALSANSATILSSTNAQPLTLNLGFGQDGGDENTVAITTLSAAYDLYKQKESIDISLLMAGKPRGGTSNTQLGNYLIDNIAEVRKDCVVFITPDEGIVRNAPGNEASALVTWKNSVRNSTYAFLDSGYKYMYDRYNDVYRYVPLNGDIAGLTARSDAATDPWYSPAGFNRGQIKNIIKLRFNPAQADRDLLYKNSINPVVSFPGQGTILYGDKTATSRPSAFDRLNVRRLFITLEKAISEASKFSLFEFNDEFTRAQFRNLVTPFLRDVQSRRGITDFLVVCDNTNNTAERIDRNEFWGDIYIKPNRSINFIQLNFVAVRTGVEFSTVIGRF